MKRCPHTVVTLCFKQGWFCHDCKQIVADFDVRNPEYRCGITLFRVGSRLAALRSAAGGDAK